MSELHDFVEPHAPKVFGCFTQQLTRGKQFNENVIFSKPQACHAGSRLHDSLKSFCAVFTLWKPYVVQIPHLPRKVTIAPLLMIIVRSIDTSRQRAIQTNFTCSNLPACNAQGGNCIFFKGHFVQRLHRRKRLRQSFMPSTCHACQARSQLPDISRFDRPTFH